MRNLIVILSLLVLAGGGYYLAKADKVSDMEKVHSILPPKNQDEQRQVPYSINHLKNTNFEGGDITIERQIAETSGFTSFIVSYSSEGLRQFALMNVPKGNMEKYPVVIINHGYINPESYSTADSYKNTSSFFAENGFLVLKPDYRSHGNSEGEDKAINRLAYAVDVLNLISSVKTIDSADSQNVFLYGHSMGGDIALRILTAKDSIKAASLWAPVARDFPESLMYFVRKHRTVDEVEKVREEIESAYEEKDYEKLSPLNYLDNIDARITIHHGTADSSVPYNWSAELEKLLNDAGVENTFHTYEGANHNLEPHFSVAANRDVEFFRSAISPSTSPSQKEQQ